ncbi:cytochrome D ubiquinol oxidase subunit I [Aneurinibacillus migulanus]|uniref:Cytochrome D ubiquinol oxidase subunit I n=1 Tax=Aneurinibacillus migulanus TaxID=47500 RepID=A0A0D1V734_ANEMI|nr:cytochrome ubiquinol oxidase subunit I [Aneurinibacillus migulanus]KIV55099.1 cytochrome D ubiquinol oxidase subunit I [Aneurinibacillus migulanus]KIV56519.1 cytochrome D ubiquinol oxidase subunit I [Aneurinibacillus migulanus]KON95275.1 cytochrome D ubiquinol oxidase subunit I [Aneurinibacillus migulanus]KPD06129.1 cytochrome D ubiquinol oxidase subunit I [Aneurinibacillus migulanus]MCP1356114.1 cytochrome ubiquinol oxidase subunit I [Aneurinibacillus migulanus]
MDDLQLARAMFGTTMGFHIIFATLGVGLPLMILGAEILYHWKKDRDYHIMAQRWTKGFAVLLGVAIPSGTIAGVQLSLLWPGFMEVVGKVIALPFQIEIFAFLLEALFMSIYVYAADRLSPGMRILSVSLIALGALASAVLITNVHAFEGTPAGFRIENGQVVDVDPWAGFFNPSFVVSAVHVGLSAYMTGAFAIASVAAYKMLKRRRGDREFTFHRKALMMALAIGGLFSIGTALNGHESAQYLHEYQPEKLAAAEGLFETQAYAPLAIGGFTDEATQSVKYGIEVPWALSFLAGNRFDEVVKGLNDFPREYWPPLYIHTLFNGMVAIGSLLILLSIIGFVWRHLMKREGFPRWLMWLFIASGPLAMMGIEFGWIFACTGRQPWVLYRTMLTADSVTQSENIGLLFALFVSIYLLLGIATVVVLRHYFKRHPLEKELEKRGALGS